MNTQKLNQKFMPFSIEDLNREPFIFNEVQFNIFHSLAGRTLDVALKSKDSNMIGLYCVGQPMWLWVNENLKQATIQELINAFSTLLEEKKLFGIAGAPKISKAFALEYSSSLKIKYSFSMSMGAYYCPQISKPKCTPGKISLAEKQHTELIAKFCAGFLLDCFSEQVTVKSQYPLAEKLIDSKKLYLWIVNNSVVSMANIAHQSPRHSRINYLYTPLEQRKNGYATSLTAEVSSLIHKLGSIPILYADVKNQNVNRLYKKIGFKETGKIDEYYFQYD